MASLFYLVLWLSTCSGFHLYEPSHPSKKVTRLFERLKHFEIISIKHNQFHGIDSGDAAIYPMNGKLEFHAFGRYYKLLIRKNMELFSDNFVIEHHSYDNITNSIHKTQSYDVPQCHYTAEVVSDPSGIHTARFSACRGRGLRGWVYAFGETIVIRPKRLLTDGHYKGKHRISDTHIVYRYHDVDRSDYDTKCGHSHESHLHEEHQHIVPDLFNHFNNNTHSTWRDKRRLQASLSDNQIRYVELAVVNDPGLIDQYNNDRDELIAKAVESIATVQAFYYHTDWGSYVGTVQIVLSHIGFVTAFSDVGLHEPDLSCDGDATEANLYQKTHGDDYCEIYYDSYLSVWHSYRQEMYSEYDNAQLLSYYDFKDSVIGYASISGMCNVFTSGAIDQVTYDDEYNGNIIAHEMGHNFGMQHDGLGNTCDAASYIMASKGSTGARPSSFSSCSISAMQTFFVGYSRLLQCLDNKPLATDYAVCRNGFIELGEVCDCGQEDCTLSGDKCCDGSTCGLYAFAECSNQYECCSAECSIIRPEGDESVVCRELNGDNACDIEEELCDGLSAECAPDTFYNEGTACNEHGYCYYGSCKSIEDQCSDAGHEIADSKKCGYSPWWQIAEDECDSDLKCLGQLRTYESTKQCITSDPPVDGTPCNKSHIGAAQCSNGYCSYSSSILSVQWTAYAWNECSISCKSDGDDNAGNQSRIVLCTHQDGTQVEDTDSVCDEDSKPVSLRICNDYVCNFCSFAAICGDNGVCDEKRGICDCDSGYGGEFCDVSPSLNFTGVVSMVYNDLDANQVILEIANPCFGTNLSVISGYDSATETRTVPQDGVHSLDALYIGSTIGIRWRSTGSIDSLAVGMVAVDSETGLYDDSLSSDDWPFYVGHSLALNQGNGEFCDEFDECFNDLTCNDFTFVIPTSISIGDYRIVIRFNNVFNLLSHVLHIFCSESNCNAAGHGSCGDDGCICDDGWSGNSCSDSICSDWRFATEGETVGEGQIKPKCFSSQCDYNNSTQPCGANNECSDPHFEGFYCELPRDYCSTLTTSSSECNADSECVYSVYNDNELCVYSDCYSFKTKEDCEINGANSTMNRYIASDSRWSIFCEWMDDSYCNRITCGDSVLPECANGAVRKPLYDIWSESPQSICNGWYCDCSTVTDHDGDLWTTYWTTSDSSILLSSISSDYSLSSSSVPLTADYLSSTSTSLSLFVCSSCDLSCGHGSNHGGDYGLCSDCSDECPIEENPYRSGVECNQVFWILSFALNIEESLLLSDLLISDLLISDLSYFLGTDFKHISIWEIKPHKDGDKTIIYFRYLFDTDSDDETQTVGGDIMILAQKEFEDATSAASRGFVMKFTDSQYRFAHCIPSKEECDPQHQISMSAYLYGCFFCSFAFVLIVVAIYRFATQEKREKEYEEKVMLQKRMIVELHQEKKNATRIGMRDVSRKRAKEIANARREIEELQQIQKTVYLSGDSPKAGGRAQWITHTQEDEEENTHFNEIEAIKLNNENENENETETVDACLPKGWQQITNEDGETYYFDNLNQVQQWERPPLVE